MDLNFNELRELVAAINQTDVAELTLKSSEFELTLRKTSAVGSSAGQSQSVTTVAAPAASSKLEAAVPESPPLSTAPIKPADSLLKITSPIVGTFYRAPGPDEVPFVEVGDRVQLGQTVCIIEAMKLMNELESEIAGEIVEILVENSEPVEFGQTLMLVRPA